MRILLDTQVWLWLQTEPERLGRRALRRLESANAEAILSSVSCWEIAIKFALGKLSLPEPPGVYVPKRIASSGVETLAVTVAHALQTAQLPAHHRDPFDRMLVAQAQADGLTILTADRSFTPYKVPVIWAGRAPAR